MELSLAWQRIQKMHGKRFSQPAESDWKQEHTTKPNDASELLPSLAPMEVDPRTIRRMLEQTAEALIEDAETLETDLQTSTMTPDAEKFWFGEPQQERVNFLRWAACRMRLSAAYQLPSAA